MSKKIVTLLLALLMLLSLSAAVADEIVVTDMFGRRIALSGPAQRIVVMEPADCEILCALGCEERIVARGLYCDYPASVTALPALQSGSNTNVEELLALMPDVVIMSGMDHPKEQVDMLESCGVKVVCTYAASIPEVYEAIGLLGQVTGETDAAQAIVADMQATFADIAAKAAQSDATIYFEVMPLEWGLWSAGSGTFMQELAEMCGMSNAFADLEGWQPISQEQVIARSPDYIVLVTGMGDTAVDEVMNRPGWEDVTAIRNGTVFNADSYAMTRPSPRLMNAALDLYNFLNSVGE